MGKVNGGQSEDGKEQVSRGGDSDRPEGNAERPTPATLELIPELKLSQVECLASYWITTIEELVGAAASEESRKNLIELLGALLHKSSVD